MSSMNLKLISLLFLAVPITAFSGIGERGWSLSPGETDSKDFTDSFFGAEYLCERFSPSQVSFTLTYTNEKPDVKHGNNGSVTDIGDKTLKIEGVEMLHVSYRGGGVYKLKNITNEYILGTECDAGFY